MSHNIFCRKSFIIPTKFLLRTIIWSKKTSAKKQLPYRPVMGWKPITRAMLSPKKLKYLIFVSTVLPLKTIVSNKM